MLLYTVKDEKQTEAEVLVYLLSGGCHSIEDVHQLLKGLFKGTLESMLEAEMKEHLGYKKHSNAGDLRVLNIV